MSEREQNFERMLAEVRENYRVTAAKVEGIKAEGKVKSAPSVNCRGIK